MANNNAIVNYIMKTHEYTYSTNGFIQYKCKFCNQPLGRSGVLHAEKGIIKCFQPTCKFNHNDHFRSALGYIGWLEELISTKSIFKFLNDYGSLDFISNKTYSFPRTLTKHVKVDNLPNNYLPLEQSIILDGELDRRVYEYLVNRGYDTDFIYELSNKFKIGYIKSKHSNYYGRIIIPFFNYKYELNYLQARSFIGEEPKYKFPKTEEFPGGKSTKIYNQQFFKSYDTLFINEGVFDSWDIMKHTPYLSTILGGTSLSNFYIDYILSTNLKNIYFCLDSGTFKQALHFCKELYQKDNSKSYYIVNIPLKENNGILYKDVNEWGEYILDFIDLSYKFSLSLYLKEINRLIEIPVKSKKSGKNLIYYYPSDYKSKFAKFL